MTVAVIPVKGRGLLVPHTAQRLVDMGVKVILVLEYAHEKAFFYGMDVDCTVMGHQTLGKKWNAGFQRAKGYDPDYVLFVGSSDWVTENWLDVMIPLADECDIAGVADYYMAHIEVGIPYDRAQAYARAEVNKNILSIKAGHWMGYKGNEREGEPIGIGRVLNREFLRRIDYKPFDDMQTKSMDWAMFNKAKSFKTIRCAEHKCLSISTSLWSNYHDFYTEIRYPDSETMGREFIEKYFPHVLKLF
jgi:hypothetical protein